LLGTAVTNASPPIYLGRTENLHLIESCARKVYVTDVVVREIRAGQSEPATQAIATRRRGLVPAARPVIETLIASGLHLSDEILNGALALVGE
jgi:predicted nucleic acid-binding protein